MMFVAYNSFSSLIAIVVSTSSFSFYLSSSFFSFSFSFLPSFLFPSFLPFLYHSFFSSFSLSPVPLFLSFLSSILPSFLPFFFHLPGKKGTSGLAIPIAISNSNVYSQQECVLLSWASLHVQKAHALRRTNLGIRISHYHDN